MTELNPLQWALRPIIRYADFKGRAPRAEYWWYTLFSMVLGWIFGVIDEMVADPLFGDLGPLSLLLTLGLFIPGTAVLVRRLHDIDRTGWWALLSISSLVFLGVAAAGLANPELLADRLGNGGLAAVGIAFIVWLILMIGLLVFTITAGTEGENRFGPDPYGPDRLEEVFA